MPTATDVDTRPVAVGKWPRLRGRARSPNSTTSNALRRGRHFSSQPNSKQTAIGQHPGGKHSDWCTLENCVQNCDEEASNNCTDVLLHPHLLQEFYGDKCLTSANPLLEFCLDGGFSRKFPSEVAASFEVASQETQASLLSHCSTCSDLSDLNRGAFVPQIRVHLRQNGCDINVQDSQGLTALHHLIQGCSKENFELVMEAIKLLLSQDSLKVDIYDKKDADSVLTSLRHKLADRNLPPESLVEMASEILARFPADHINGHERTLLTYSVFEGDSTLELTRCLLNHGALILPDQSEIHRDRSAFTWLLRGVMRDRDLSRYRDTLLLLCQNMTEVVGPEVMRSHVLSTMVHLGHSASIMGPLFIDLKNIVSQFWNQPQSLVHLCRSSIRNSLGPKNVNLGVRQLKLPPSLTQYLHYHFQ